MAGSGVSETCSTLACLVEVFFRSSQTGDLFELLICFACAYSMSLSLTFSSGASSISSEVL
uniref:Uncharacterized protein n=1 Tax=Arundo donax TaxID=35708 RepID=A0A0A9TCI4_ARUDO